MIGRARPIRGLIFLALAYGSIVVIALAYAPWAARSTAAAFAGAHAWSRFVRRTARVLVGIETEVRGTPPTGEVLIAAKHQSFLDIALIHGAVPRGKFIMKAELTRAPGLGWYAKRMGCIPVDRGARGAAVRTMLVDVAAGRAEPGQIIIYGQGTRVAPGAHRPYKKGTAALYRELGQPCVPVACNVGLFWPKSGFMFRPGRAVVEFLEPIPPGLSNEEYMARLEEVIETASNRLMAEAGFDARAVSPAGSPSPRG